MPLNKREFESEAIRFAKEKDWLYVAHEEFVRNDATWTIEVRHLKTDDFPEIYITYRLGRTFLRAFVYPLEDYRADVV